MFVVEGSVGGLLSWLGFTDHFVSNVKKTGKRERERERERERDELRTASSKRDTRP